jgi:UDP-N-acetylglucosamine acyltransferase
MANIHATALVDPRAQLGADVEIGPFCIVGPEAVLGDGVVLHSHVVVTGRSTLGAGCKAFPFVSIGHAPQDQKYRGEPSRVEIGANTVIRENVTINPGTEGGGMLTSVGANCLFMVGAHVAHDCRIGDNVILVNNATLGGHVTVGDHAILGGLCAVHQFVRVGPYGFVGGMSGVERDIIPFGMVMGNRAHLAGLNLVGLKRGNFPREQIHGLRQAYRLLFAKEGTLLERAGRVEDEFQDNPLVRQVTDFIRSDSDRSYCVPKDDVSAPNHD